ncbi:hypothetical protein T492DRAFT_951217 [Pavlovales sp. CCMP2436]|nr:hypothetical protein T492DRAFT_951217 [Pavlovales sp. CCMP2436]
MTVDRNIADASRHPFHSQPQQVNGGRPAGAAGAVQPGAQRGLFLLHVLPACALSRTSALKVVLPAFATQQCDSAPRCWTSGRACGRGRAWVWRGRARATRTTEAGVSEGTCCEAPQQVGTAGPARDCAAADRRHRTVRDCATAGRRHKTVRDCAAAHRTVRDCATAGRRHRTVRDCGR